MSQLSPQSDTAVLAPEDAASTGPPRRSLAVRSHGMTDRGKVRPNNEDQFLIARLEKTLQVSGASAPSPEVQHSSDECHLFIVADGMGGHAGGEQASALAVNSVETFILETSKWFAQVKTHDQDQLLADFQRALGEANARILAEGQENAQWHGMGTTLTLAFSLNYELYVAHVGDSRCYLLREGHLHRLTSDHTLAEEMVRRGAISAEEALKHHWRHVITNAVGGDSADVKVEVHKLHLQAGDGVLLCSDGLTEMVPEEEVTRIVRSHDEPEDVCKTLVARANENGGKDNVTVVYARYEPAN